MKVYIGDITKIDADVIVNAADTDFTPGGGIARWISEEGGKEIFKEAQEYNPGEVGKSYITTAGKLPSKAVIHIPTVDWPTDTRIPIAQIHEAATIAMDMAIEKGHKSIVFPLLGAGVVKLDPLKVTKELSDAILHIEGENKDFEGSIVVLTEQVFNKIKESLPKEYEKSQLNNTITLYRGIKAKDFVLQDKNISRKFKNGWKKLLEYRANGDFTYPEELNSTVLEINKLQSFSRQYFTDNKAIAEKYAKSNKGVLVQIKPTIDDILKFFSIEFQNYSKRRDIFEIVYTIKGSDLVKTQTNGI